ncbi:MAG: HTTM domain-containing protein [Pseudomonadota bacterium]|nr:HTTM domain-containing protein [Pseudomonadota bacterium]
MTTPWARWVRYTSRDMDARPLALVRIFACVAILLDLLQVGRLGLVETLFRPWAAGGLSVVQDDANVLVALSPTWGGPVAYVVTLVCLALVALGVWTRPALVVGLLAYAQLGHLYPPGDRAIDRLLRSALLLVLVSGAHRRFALTGTRQDRVPAWPADTIRLLLVLVYLSAGVAKLQQQPGWLAWTGTPVLYRVMGDPLAAHVDPEAAVPFWPVLRVLGWGTIALECSAPLVFTRFAPYWALGGAAMHLGIALTMDLGMFSWGMLGLYPILLARLFEGSARTVAREGAAVGVPAA